MLTHSRQPPICIYIYIYIHIYIYIYVYCICVWNWGGPQNGLPGGQLRLGDMEPAAEVRSLGLEAGDGIKEKLQMGTLPKS